MSLIVARKDGDNIFIVSDTKLTYPSDEQRKLLMAPPGAGVIKSIIINPHICVSYACDDMDLAKTAIKKCREANGNSSKILHLLHTLNIDSENKIEFIVCISLVGISKIYEIKNTKRNDVDHSWIGSQEGFNIFQEKMHYQKVLHKKSKNDLSDLSSAMDEVIRSGKDESVSGFRICVSNNKGHFEYESSISVAFPPREYRATGNGESRFYITHGTAQEGGYNVHIFPSLHRHDIVAIHILQGNFGILYKIRDDSLLRPGIINDVDEVEFAEITLKEYGIGPMAYTYSFQKSYFERGNKAYAKRDFLKAIEFYDLGLKQTEISLKASLYFNKGLCLFNLKKIKEALQCFEEAKKLDNSFEIMVKKVLYGIK